MIVLDVNLLLYAYDSNSAHHAKAREWVDVIFSNGDLIGLPWQTIGAFLRIGTNRRLPGYRYTVPEATAMVETWLAQPNIRCIAPGERYWPILRTMIIEGQASGPLVTDAQLAALTIECGGILQTTDRDFARFPGLRWKNPLI